MSRRFVEMEPALTLTCCWRRTLVPTGLLTTDDDEKLRAVRRNALGTHFLSILDGAGCGRW